MSIKTCVKLNEPTFLYSVFFVITVKVAGLLYDLNFAVLVCVSDVKKKNI